MIELTKNTRHLKKHYRIDFLKDYYGDDVPGMKDILKLYLQETPKDLNQIESFMHEKDVVGVKAATHKIKTNVAMLGIIDPVEFIESMHQLAATAPITEGVEMMFLVFKSEVMKGLKDIEADFFGEK